jgi:GH35 family endo-1,4-beta-xylanase
VKQTLTCLTALLLVPLAAFAATSSLPAAAPVPEGKRLREIVATKYPGGNVFIGATIASPQIQKPGIDLQILNREFSYTTPENDFKQASVHPEPGNVWRWVNGDLYLSNCIANHQWVRIHGPMGPQVSKWALDDARTPHELRQMLTEYLTALYTRYNGQPNIRWVDVVNETVSRDGKWFGPKPGVDGWENPWTILGYDTDKNGTPLYISAAFEIAAKHATKLKLIYNQHTHLEKAATEKVKETILYLRVKGLRVDGIGWQAHVDMGWEKIPGNVDFLSETIEWAHAHKLEFHVTECNVALPKEAGPDEDGRTAETYAAIMRALLEHRNTGVVAWNCWHLRDYVVRGKTRTALLFAEDGTPKKAYYAVRRLLEYPPPVAKSQPDQRSRL